MDFDSIITVIFLIIFFIMPSILKQLQARKKKKLASKIITPKGKKTKPSIIGRIGDQIREFVEELEKQAQQQEKAAEKPDTLWDVLEEEQTSHPGLEVTGEDVDKYVTPGKTDYPGTRIRCQKDVPPEKTDRSAERIRYQREESCNGNRKEEPCSGKPMRHFRNRYCFKSDPLQNAVIWSEVLSKPIALKDE
ncbi:hypothetical protein [Desulfobacula phenolica]|uniref:Uncharacterized protein n=1 Tax=Desulfobacula phenolica TaxID=90732 RepID=A0A1H2J011_9BACT|nr:hypothetical protein [Desulfobacula phenolica]SDU49496.1 hypothetical protein SAMN04487931_11034 [Desulfobacula phenolica]